MAVHCPCMSIKTRVHQISNSKWIFFVLKVFSIIWHNLIWKIYLYPPYLMSTIVENFFVWFLLFMVAYKDFFFEVLKDFEQDNFNRNVFRKRGRKYCTIFLSWPLILLKIMLFWGHHENCFFLLSRWFLTRYEWTLQFVRNSDLWFW